jgi:8-oxo-dGTP pyrophosphatase MutT (NUDIX family)
MSDQTSHDPAEEMLDVVDADDVVIRQARRAEVYAQGLRHRTAFVLVRDSRGHIFVHRRTDTKLIFPGRYDMFVGGVVQAGESYDAAARREASEELGIDDLPAPTFLFSFPYEGTAGSWFSAVYTVRQDPPVRPQAEEIAWSAFIAEAELELRLHEWLWVPDGLEAYRRLKHR